MKVDYNKTIKNMIRDSKKEKKEMGSMLSASSWATEKVNIDGFPAQIKIIIEYDEDEFQPYYKKCKKLENHENLKEK